MNRTNLLSFDQYKPLKSQLKSSSVAGAAKKANSSTEDVVKVQSPEEDYLKLHLCHYKVGYHDHEGQYQMTLKVHLPSGTTEDDALLRFLLNGHAVEIAIRDPMPMFCIDYHNAICGFNTIGSGSMRTTAFAQLIRSLNEKIPDGQIVRKMVINFDRQMEERFFQEQKSTIPPIDYPVINNVQMMIIELVGARRGYNVGIRQPDL